MIEVLWRTFLELVAAPFHQPEMVWGIVPLYFGWILNELTSGRPSFHTAIQTGFGFIWAAAHWVYQQTRRGAGVPGHMAYGGFMSIQGLVTLLIFAFGVVALISGLRRKYPKGWGFLGHSRFSNYFMIAIFPIQSGFLAWTVNRFLAVLGFAVPLWMLLQIGFMPLRRK